jgi:hypothetical protein
VVNIGTVPLLVTILGLMLALAKRRKLRMAGAQ